MAAALLHRSARLMCPHGGTVTITSTNSKTKAGGDFLARAGDTFLITGCPFIAGLVPHPCVNVKWSVSAQQSRASGDFTLTEQSVGFCVAADQAVQGAVQILQTQTKVSGR